MSICPNVHRFPHQPVLIVFVSSFDLLPPPPTKLGQGNIFRSVCQEFCSRGGGGSKPRPRGEVGGSDWGGCLGPEPGGRLGGLARAVQAHTQGGFKPRPEGCVQGCGFCCGRYASYWNAFLLNIVQINKT